MTKLPAFGRALLLGPVLALSALLTSCAASAQSAVVVRPAPRPYYAYPVRPYYRPPVYRRPPVLVVPARPVIVAPAPPRYYYYNVRPRHYIRVR